METNIEKYLEQIELKDIEIHKLRNKAQVSYALCFEAVPFFEAIKENYTVPEELRKLARIWLSDYAEFFPQAEPIHHGNK